MIKKKLFINFNFFMIELPKTKIPAETQDPKYLILFGLPKVGKTTVLASLENNLILDL